MLFTALFQGSDSSLLSGQLGFFIPKVTIHHLLATKGSVFSRPPCNAYIQTRLHSYLGSNEVAFFILIKASFACQGLRLNTSQTSLATNQGLLGSSATTVIRWFPPGVQTLTAPFSSSSRIVLLQSTQLKPQHIAHILGHEPRVVGVFSDYSNGIMVKVKSLK